MPRSPEEIAAEEEYYADLKVAQEREMQRQSLFVPYPKLCGLSHTGTCTRMDIIGYFFFNIVYFVHELLQVAFWPEAELWFPLAVAFGVCAPSVVAAGYQMG